MDSTRTSQTSQLNWLLKAFTERVAHTLSAVVASTDGIKIHSHGLGIDEADRFSASITSLFSLARKAATEGQPVSGNTQYVQVAHDDVQLFIMAAGNGALLGVQTTPEADPGVVGHEMAQLVRSVCTYLAARTRSEATAASGGAAS